MSLEPVEKIEGWEEVEREPTREECGGRVEIDWRVEALRVLEDERDGVGEERDRETQLV